MRWRPILERLEEEERAGQLRRALDLLAPDKREVLLLARFGELKHDRIADLLGISPGAVRVRLHRALKDLREAYRQVTAEELRDFARTVIAPYKCPRVVEFRTELPRTSTGKLQRYKLR